MNYSATFHWNLGGFDTNHENEKDKEKEKRLDSEIP